MRVVVLEDEYGVAQNLCDILLEIEPDIEISAIIETVKEAVKWVNNNPKPDLGFFDIRLADGDSFEIFEKVKISFPVIFTTAYDEYALRAFKVNSIDYLLKNNRRI
ncbi:MAG: response regulator [Bacteroidales bacterium]|nr:response regulator [Bacteroidales bacterium]